MSGKERKGENSKNGDVEGIDGTNNEDEFSILDVWNAVGDVLLEEDEILQQNGDGVGIDGTNNEVKFAMVGVWNAVGDVFLKEDEFYQRTELFIVDANRDIDGQVLKAHSQSLMTSVGVGTAFRMGSMIYLLGYDLIPEDRIPDTVRYSSKKTFSCLKGLSCLDLNGHSSCWKRLASPEVYGYGLEYAALNGKIYCVPSGALDKACVYVPDKDIWAPTYSPIPMKFRYHTVSKYLITDPVNNCILIHLHDGSDDYTSRNPSSIYAWYPEIRVHDSSSRLLKCENWECVVPKFSTRGWQKKTLLVDGMLLFYYRKTSKLFSAFDLKSKTWLDIVWSREYPSYLRKLKVRSMFHLGNGRIWVCMSLGIRAPVSGTLVRFFVCDFQRPTDVVKPTIIFSFCFVKSFYARYIRRISDFIPLGDIHP